MKMTTPFTILNNSINELWRMNDFKYQVPKATLSKYWDEEYILHPTNSQCKIFDD